ncbi:uncharacterized protein LOC125646917 [Ostrea edulis]|uniref:uncharacterized protein LOC125646917 n=1 Tax=Ostrea edulis TaxID=37623 RepID=UPI0024AF43A8|nr:uncharacterized protein LOC125646917 [Ostrea edulis]
MAVILKEKHSFLGKSIMPVMMELKVVPTPTQFARLKKDHPLERYKLEELQHEFKKLTGEELTNVLALAGKPANAENAIHALYLAILQANNVGAPKGSLLKEIQDRPSSEPIQLVSGMTVTPPQSRETGSLESRMKKLEENLATQHKQSVDDALRNVRTITARPKLVSPEVLIAALEALVDSASVGNHPDKDFFKKSLIACRQH